MLKLIENKVESECRKTCNTKNCICDYLVLVSENYKDYKFDSNLVFKVDFHIENNTIIKINSGEQVNFKDDGYPFDLHHVYDLNYDNCKELIDNLESSLEDGHYEAFLEIYFEEFGYETKEWESFGVLKYVLKNDRYC